MNDSPKHNREAGRGLDAGPGDRGPGAGATGPSAAGAGESPCTVRGQVRVLVVDDEEIVRTTLQQMLQYLGYAVLLARDGPEALARYAEAARTGSAVDLVILDLTLQGEREGEVVLARLREIDPGVKAIVSSGYAGDPVMTDFERYGFCGAICKPYRIGELHRIVDAALQTPVE